MSPREWLSAYILFGPMHIDLNGHQKAALVDQANKMYAAYDRWCGETDLVGEDPDFTNMPFDDWDYYIGEEWRDPLPKVSEFLAVWNHPEDAAHVAWRAVPSSQGTGKVVICGGTESDCGDGFNSYPFELFRAMDMLHLDRILGIE